jgi:hypothetical protein
MREKDGSMKPRSAALLTAILFALLVWGCTSMHRGATDVNVSGEDIVYLKDERTNLCFAVLFIQNKVGTSVRTMGMTDVPCEDLGHAPTK